MIFVLGAISRDMYNAEQKYMLLIPLLIAWKTITANWKETKPPTITQWTQRNRCTQNDCEPAAENGHLHTNADTCHN